MKSTAFVIAALALAVLAYWQGCERGSERASGRVDSVMVQLPAKHDTLTLTRISLRRSTETVTDTVVTERLLRQIDTVIERVGGELVACVDTVVHQDTVHACFEYRGRRLTLAYRFAPEFVPLPPAALRAPWLRTSFFLAADVDQSTNVYAGAGMQATLAGSVTVYGLLGLNRQPFAAVIHGGARIEL